MSFVNCYTAVIADRTIERERKQRWRERELCHRLDWFRSAWQGKAVLQRGIQIFFSSFYCYFLSGFTLTGLVQYSELEGGDSII